MSDTILPDEHHLKLLRLLEANPSMSQRDLSRGLGISLGKTNYCVKHLLDRGFIKMQNFRNSRNKLAYAYLLTPSGFAAKLELTLQFLNHKVCEYENLKAEIELLALEAALAQATSKTALQDNT